MNWLVGHRQQVVFLALLVATGLAVQWAYPRLNPQWMAYHQGASDLAARDYAAAARSLARAVELGARRPIVWRELGQAYLAQERLEPAREAFLELARLRPDDPEALWQVVGLDERLGQTRSALDFLAEVERDAGLDYALLLKLGDLRQRLQDLAGAQRAFARALALRPDAQEARLRLAEALTWSQEYPQAISLLEEILAARPDQVQARLRLARILGVQGRNQEAIAQYRLALGEKP